MKIILRKSSKVEHSLSISAQKPWKIVLDIYVVEFLTCKYNGRVVNLTME